MSEIEILRKIAEWVDKKHINGPEVTELLKQWRASPPQPLRIPPEIAIGEYLYKRDNNIPQWKRVDVPSIVFETVRKQLNEKP